VFALINDAYRSLYSVVPLSDAQARFYAQAFFGFLRLLRALRANDRLDLLLVAVRQDCEQKGLGAVLTHETWKSAAARGIRYAEASPQLEMNPRVRALWSHFESRQHRRRRCYVKALRAE
jgi:ribosomal protein S18 acetylase RimI-like enzyme